MIMYIKTLQKLILRDLYDTTHTLITDATVKCTVKDKFSGKVLLRSVELHWNAEAQRYEYEVAAESFNPDPGSAVAIYDVWVDGRLVKHKEPSVDIVMDE